MHALLIGTGMQGRAALHHLANSPGITTITAADRNVDATRRFAEARGGDESRITWVTLDAGDAAALGRLFANRPDVAIDLLPVPFIGAVAHAAASRRPEHVLRDTGTSGPGSARARSRRHAAARARHGSGHRPAAAGDAARRFDRVTEVLCYGAGVPEPAAATKPLKYKISWTFEGVLRSYLRPASLVQDGRVVHLPETAQFAPEHSHAVAVNEVGVLEAFPNGDVLPYLRLLGVDPSGVRRAGRFAMRYPGHSAFWKTMVDLHLLDDDAVLVDGVAVNRRRFLAAALEPHLRVTVRASATSASSGSRWPGCATVCGHAWCTRWWTGAI
jgi:saccharopine dehydrogenase-like NADP-dependent oxidoreductase